MQPPLQRAPSDLRDLWQGRVIDWSSRLLLAGFWSLFLVSHVRAFAQTGKPSLAVFSVAESLVVALFLLRRRADLVSWHPMDIAVAVWGTSLPLFHRPTVHPDLIVGEVLILAGLAGQIGGLLSLRRSFGVFPANRGVQTGGLYRLVRHPMYGSYALLYTGYLVSNATLWNGFLLVLALGFQVARACREERLLSDDERYRAYMDRVRWRMIPGVF